jgi:hypothetical protein
VQTIKIGEVTIDAVIGAGGFRSRVGDDVHHVSDLRRPEAALHHSGEYLHRGGQRASATIRFPRQGALDSAAEATLLNVTGAPVPSSDSR